MTEREMEDLLAKYPEKFFPRRILTLKGRQVTLPGGMRFDLEYEDQDGNTHLIELKAVAAKLEHVEQLTRYKKGLVEQGRKRIWLWLIAPTIPKNLIEFLDDNGIQHAEITMAEYKQVAEEVGYEFSSERQKQATGAPIPADEIHAPSRSTDFQSNPDNRSTRERVIEILQDRQWHTKVELKRRLNVKFLHGVLRRLEKDGVVELRKTKGRIEVRLR